MPSAGDSYTVTLSNTHLEWGIHRYTNSRDAIYGEGYIPIPSSFAEEKGVYNSNFKSIGLGFNEYRAKSSDGFFNGILKSTGNNKKGSIYAKNLHGSGDLKALGGWFEHVNMQPGDEVEVTWITEQELILKKL